MLCRYCQIGEILTLTVDLESSGQVWAKYKGHEISQPNLKEIGIFKEDGKINICFCTQCGKLQADFPLVADELTGLFDGPYWCDKCEKEFPFPDSVCYCEMCARELCDDCADWHGTYVYERFCKSCWAEHKNSIDDEQ